MIIDSERTLIVDEVEAQFFQSVIKSLHFLDHHTAAEILSLNVNFNKIVIKKLERIVNIIVNNGKNCKHNRKQW